MLVCLLFYEIYLFAYTFLLYLFSRLGTANSRTTINRINSRSASLRSHGGCCLVGSFQSQNSTTASVKRKRFLHSNGSVSHHSTCKFSQESSAKNTNMSKYKYKTDNNDKKFHESGLCSKIHYMTLYDEKWKHSQLCSCRYCWNSFDVHK